MLCRQFMVDLRFKTCLRPPRPPPLLFGVACSLWSLLSYFNCLSKSSHFAKNTMDSPVHISKAWCCEVKQLWALGQVDECLQSHLWSCIRGDLFGHFKHNTNCWVVIVLPVHRHPQCLAILPPPGRPAKRLILPLNVWPCRSYRCLPLALQRSACFHPGLSPSFDNNNIFILNILLK